MEFGKVDTATGIDFSLPEDPAGNASLLGGSASVGAALHLGLTGWGEKAWVGSLYPSGTRPADYLKAYAKSFHAVELNSSFYAMPESGVIDRWLMATPDAFRFMVKVPQALSHQRNQETAIQDIVRFGAAMRRFGSKATACFLQYPPDQVGQVRKSLQAWLDHWPSDGQRLFVEFRDPGLLLDEDMLEAMARSGLGLVITDTAGRRDLVHMRLLVPEVMVRFVATGAVEADRLRLVAWKERLSAWFREGLEQAWFFCHTHDNRHAPELARLFRDMVTREEPRWAESIPEINVYGARQTELFQTTR